MQLKSSDSVGELLKKNIFLGQIFICLCGNERILADARDICNKPSGPKNLKRVEINVV